MGKATVNILVCVLWQTDVCTYVKYLLRIGILGSLGGCVFGLEDFASQLSRWLCLFTFPPAMYKRVPVAPHPCQHLASFCLFHCSHSGE